jgi:hypothetical protein
MDFTVLKATATGNLLLKSDSGGPIAGRMPLYLGRKEACVVHETIGSVSDPLYLAEPRMPDLVGKTLTNKK